MYYFVARDFRIGYARMSILRKKDEMLDKSLVENYKGANFKTIFQTYIIYNQCLRLVMFSKSIIKLSGYFPQIFKSYIKSLNSQPRNS